MISSDAAVSVQSASKIFGSGSSAFTALNNVSVEIRQNEFFTLLGPSGCGKTTLLRLIAGFERPSSGRILLDGGDISDIPPYKRPVNTVFQNYALFPHMTVAQNIAFGLEMLRKPQAEIESVTADMLRLVRMESLAGRRIAQISGGQQQRVALARALAPRPKVLLLDEPLSALDLQLRKEMQLELKRLQTETGITFIFVTHDQEEALTMSDRLAVMNDGEILQVGTQRDIYDRPQHRFVAGFIGDINLIEAISVAKGTYDIAKCGRIGSAPDNKAPTGSVVALAIRPERISLGKPIDGKLTGTVTDVVYHGTDTIFHFDLPNNTKMRARVQNNTANSPQFAPGDFVGWSADPASVSILTEEAS